MTSVHKYGGHKIDLKVLQSLLRVTRRFLQIILLFGYVPKIGSRFIAKVWLCPGVGLCFLLTTRAQWFLGLKGESGGVDPWSNPYNFHISYTLHCSRRVI